MLVAQPKAAVIALALVAVVAAPSPASSVEVRVRATTTLTVEPTTVGRRLTLEGTLRNNLNQGLADQAIRVTMTPIELRAGRRAGRYRPTEQTATTGQHGHFRVIDVLADGTWSIRVEFDGGDYLAATNAETQLDIRRERLELSLQAPTASPSWSPVPIDVIAVSPSASTEGLPLRLRLDGRRANTMLVTDAFGEASVRIDPPRRSGPLQVEVVFTGDNRFEPASVQQDTLLYERAELGVVTRVQPLRDTTFLAIAGQLERTDQSGGDRRPIEGASIGLLVADRIVSRSAVTDANGHYQLVDVVDDLPNGVPLIVTATYDPLGAFEPDLRVSAVAEFTIEELPFAKTRNWAGLIAVVLLGGLLLALAVGRAVKEMARRKDRVEVLPMPGRAAPDGLIELSPRRPGRDQNVETRISGTVRDADTTKPIDGGELSVDGPAGDPITLPIAANGAFSTESLTAGLHRIRFAAPGYVATKLEVSVPHRGQYHDIEVYLCSVRSWIRYLYQRLTYLLSLDDEGQTSWGRATPRQIELLLIRAYREAFEPIEDSDSGFQAFQKAVARVLDDPDAPTSDQMLRTLTLLVEEVYYSQRIYAENMVELCQTLVDGVKEITEVAG